VKAIGSYYGETPTILEILQLLDNRFLRNRYRHYRQCADNELVQFGSTCLIFCDAWTCIEHFLIDVVRPDYMAGPGTERSEGGMLRMHCKYYLKNFHSDRHVSLRL
jgi:hypothetical protein